MIRHIIGPEDGELVLNLGALASIKVPSEATRGQFALIEHTVPPRGGPPPHTHAETELLYILSGRFEVLVGAERVEVGPGTIIHVPPRTLHTTCNIGNSAGRQLSLYVPGGAEGFFREAGTRVTSLRELPNLDEPANLEGVDVPRVLDIARNYGMEVRTGTDHRDMLRRA
jgi:mannose-6-phosphate isomerase-like protein (cupin superfamily)